MLRTPLSATPLSTHAGILRRSLLLSLGLSPLACGGSTVVTGHNGAGGSTQQATGGTRDPGSAGATPTAPNGGHSNAGYGGDWDPPPTGVGGMGPVGSGGTASAGKGGTAGRGGAGTGGAIDPSACPNPVTNPTTKLTVCSNGRQHRPMSTACTYTSTGGTGGGNGASGGNGAGGSLATPYCMSDADCSGMPLGYCSREGGQVPECKSGCITDADCGASAVCTCDGIHPGRCVGAECATDADCGPNSLCAVADGGCGDLSFRCTSLLDACVSGDECATLTCQYQDGHRMCSNYICGRPFLVEREARMAAVEARADWLDATLAPDPSALTPIERAQLAAHWARLGRMEHASIAAFARFNLQLLSLGAPSHLVEACNRALADETAHARSCFALASAYGGHAVGPAHLDIERCFEDTSLVAIAKLVLREGCLGETVAALEAVAAAEVATDSTVKQTLTRIAHDELNHAELAFQFLRWALAMSSAEERHELACEAAQQLADFESEARNGERSPTNDRLAAHGLLGSDALRVIHLAAAKDVSRPLLAALFDIEASNRA